MESWYEISKLAEFKQNEIVREGEKYRKVNPDRGRFHLVTKWFKGMRVPK